ncbi:hypothetical protein SC499_10815 [Peribacillus simplex]|uniref:hypothetical protein n=1 Tax=Peribacillus simplex TaxID=1478 RepID=UPI00298EC10F|nr:hypothetical protein [Peribacillus simplex]MDW7615202.1 hypothetical protein [Peribacillus simplex]
MSYYKLGIISPSDITPSDIIQTVYGFTAAIIVFIIVYMLVTLVVIFASEAEDKNFKIIINLFAIPFALSIVFKFITNINNPINWMLFIFYFLILILHYSLYDNFLVYKKLISKIKVLVSRFYNTLFSIWIIIPYFNWIIIICSLYGIFMVFNTYGKTVAERNEDYIIIHEKSSTFVVVGKDKENLIVAPMDLESKIITPKYRVIESKSSMGNPLVLEEVKFKGGLKVKELEKY